MTFSQIMAGGVGLALVVFIVVGVHSPGIAPFICAGIVLYGASKLAEDFDNKD